MSVIKNIKLKKYVNEKQDPSFAKQNSKYVACQVNTSFLFVRCRNKYKYRRDQSSEKNYRL